MGMEIGGRASKLGDTYERLWAVRHALMVIDGRFSSLLWEPIGEDENGVDLWVTRSDGRRIAHQLKRQNRSKEYWSIADLAEEGVLQYARGQLERDTSARYTFVSSCGVRHLRDFAEQSERANDDPAVFYRDIVCQSEDGKAEFERLMLAWEFDPALPTDVARAFQLLQRTEFLVQERSKSERDQVEFNAGLLMDGAPAAAVAVIGGFLDASLGKALHADELRKKLKQEGFQFRNLAGDPTLPGAIEQLQYRFDTAIAGELIAGAPISRPETAELATKLTGDKPARLIFVHGQPGSGKSVVLHQAFKALSADGVPCLPIQLHVRRPDGVPAVFGRSKLGLPASPGLSLRGLAGDRHAVVLLDQLDALRLTSSHSHEAWEACAALIDEVLADPRTTVVVACRTFDLQNDPNIAAWRRRLQDKPSNHAIELKVGDLPDETVADLLDQHATNYASLPDRQRKLLRQPAALAMWWRLASAGQPPAQFTNATQLMRELLTLRRLEASRDHGVPAEDLNHVVSELVTFMDSHGRLDAPESLVADRGSAVNALCATGLVKRDGSRLVFAHQGYFDHLVAEYVLREALRGKRDTAQWLKANQSLFRRDQLRQLLTLLRDTDPAQHSTLIRSVLLDSDVRFHLKHLVLGLLREAEPPLDHEVQLVAELAENADWWTHVQGVVLWSKVAWFDALHISGHLAEWLSSWTDDQTVQALLSSFRPISSHRGSEIDELLAPYWSAEGPWPGRLQAVFWVDPADDSPRMSAYRLERIRAGEWQFDGLYLDRIAERCPTRVVPLLAAVSEAWISRIRRHMRGQKEPETPGLKLRDDRLNAKVVAAIRNDAEYAWPIFAGMLRLLSTLRKLANRGNRTAEDFANRDWQLSRILDSACEILESLVTAAVEGLAASRPERIVGLLGSLTAPKTRGLERAIMKGLAFGGDSLADDSLSWLCARPSRFRLGDGHNETNWEPARALIARFSPHCSTTVFHRLEEEILGYHDAWERKSVEWQLDNLRDNRIIPNDYGRAQNVLLTALLASRTSERAKLVASAWRAKFGDPANEDPALRTAVGGRVVSPIPPDKLTFVSDREWLRIIKSKWPEREARRWREHGSGLVGEASVRHFSEALGDATKRSPQRFTALALKIPHDSDPRYAASIVQALTDSGRDASLAPVTTETLEAIIGHFGECNEEGYVMAVCRLIESRRETRWSDDVVERLLSYVDHPEPAPGEFTVHAGAGTDEEAKPDVGGTALNCVRGAVASALTQLLWVRPDALDRIVSGVDRLLADSHPSVRYEALGACLPLLNHDKDLAVRMALAACDHEDDRVLESRWLNRLIQYARSTHLDNLAPLIQRMAGSTIDDVAESGSAWACVCWLDDQRFADLVAECRAGSKAQRLGVTLAASDYLANGRAVDLASQVLLDSFDDQDRDVRVRAASVFRTTDVFAADSTARVAAGFVASGAFLHDPGDLLHPLTEYAGELARYSDVVLKAADVMAGPLAEQTRDLRERNAFAGNELSTLLIRVYELAYGSQAQTLQEQCLDRWDKMLQARVGMTEEHLRQLDD